MKESIHDKERSYVGKDPSRHKRHLILLQNKCIITHVFAAFAFSHI